MMRFRESRGLEVVSTAEAVTVARVDGYVVDPERHRISALHLHDVQGDGSLVSFEDLQAFGRDAVTISDTSVIREPRDEREDSTARGRLDLIGKRVLTETGNELGRIDDVEFDPTDGTITALMTERESIEGSRLLGVGSYAVVVASSSGSHGVRTDEAG